MKWFINRKLAVKLLSSFFLVSLIAGIVGLIGYIYINDIGNHKLPGVSLITSIQKDYSHLASNDNLLLSPNLSYEDRATIHDEDHEIMDNLTDTIDRYKSIKKTPEAQELWQTVETASGSWVKGHEVLHDLMETFDALGIENPSEVRFEFALREKDHINWIWQLSEDIDNERPFTGELDPSKCRLGKWLSTYKSRSQELSKYIDDIVIYHEAVHKSAREINIIMESDSTQKRADAMKIYMDVTIPQMERVLEILENMDDTAEISEIILDEMTAQVLSVNDANFSMLTDAMNDLVAYEESAATRSVNRAVLIMSALTIVAILLSMILGLVISNMIRNPVHEMLEVANSIADGNLDVDIHIDMEDEIGDLAKALEKMSNNVNTSVYNINNASHQVALGSMQLSDASVSLSQGATEQAGSIEELSASIKDISGQINSNSDSATRASVMTNNMMNYVKHGNEQMANMLVAMSDIHNSSNNISRIIKVIDDIAFQTNILALNAAVESARAGEQGKGFAVVADEVRSLAARSANAAKETTSMIEEAIAIVDDGTRIARTTADALDKIVEEITEATNLVAEIARVSKEQAIGVDEVNQGLSQISEVVQTTSAAAEQTAAASEELSSQAKMLSDQVAMYRLKQKSYRQPNVDSNHDSKGMVTEELMTNKISLATNQES